MSRVSLNHMHSYRLAVSLVVAAISAVVLTGCAADNATAPNAVHPCAVAAISARRPAVGGASVRSSPVEAAASSPATAACAARSER